MRKILTSIVAVIFFMALQPTFTSCSKTNTKIINDTVTVVERDTIVQKDTALTIQILTANSWKILEIRALTDSMPLLYRRGGTANTDDFDNEYITFKADNTGIYTDNNAFQTTFTWNFTDATNTSLTWTWNLPAPEAPVVVTWENIYYKNAAIHYDEYYFRDGKNVLSAGIRIPK